MKVAGVIGFILALAVLGAFIYSLTQSSSTPTVTQGSTLSKVSPDLLQSGGILALFIIVIIASEFFAYGFLRMGREAGSRFLPFAARWQMILIIALVVLVLIFGLMFFLSEDNPSSSIAVLLYFFLITSFLYSFAVIVSIVASVGLVEISQKVRFAKSTGIFLGITLGLSLFTLIFSQLSLAFMIIAAFGGGGSALSTLPYILKTISVLTNLAAITYLILGSLALFDASRKFEK